MNESQTAPIVLVHGIFGFSQLTLGGLKIAEYFRLIPDALGRDGHVIPTPPQLNPAGSIAERAQDLKNYLQSHNEILNKKVHTRCAQFGWTGCAFHDLEAGHGGSGIVVDDDRYTTPRHRLRHRKAPHRGERLRHLRPVPAFTGESYASTVAKQKRFRIRATPYGYPGNFAAVRTRFDRSFKRIIARRDPKHYIRRLFWKNDNLKKDVLDPVSNPYMDANKIWLFKTGESF
jgi:hypothetical protein